MQGGGREWCERGRMVAPQERYSTATVHAYVSAHQTNRLLAGQPTWMASRLVEPLRRSTASTASSAKCSFSATTITEWDGMGDQLGQ